MKYTKYANLNFKVGITVSCNVFTSHFIIFYTYNKYQKYANSMHDYII